MAYQSTSASPSRPSVAAALRSVVRPFRQVFASERPRRGGGDITALSDHLRRDLGFEPAGSDRFSGLSQLRG